MAKREQKRSIFSGCLLNLAIGLIIIVGALGWAAYQGIDLTGALNTMSSIISGNKEKVKESAKKAKESLKETTSTSSSRQELETTTKPQGTVDEVEQETTAYYEALNYTRQARFYFGHHDGMNRASWGRVQVKYSDIPKDVGEKEPKVSFDPLGWHDYKFKYEDKDGKLREAQLMERGHLIGHLFYDEIDDDKNVIPITRYLNVGTISDKETDPDNPYCMLYYETRLIQWLKDHPDYKLDYYVHPNYKKDELVPRSVSLFWSAYDSDGKQIRAELAEPGKETYEKTIGSVTLKNVSRNAEINYEKGTAKPVYK